MHVTLYHQSAGGSSNPRYAAMCQKKQVRRKNTWTTWKKNHFSECESRNVFQNALGRGFSSTQKSAVQSGHFHEVLTDADRVMTAREELQLLRSPPPVKRPKLSAAQFDQFTPSVQIANSCSVPSNFTEKKTLVDQTPTWGRNSC